TKKPPPTPRRRPIHTLFHSNLLAQVRFQRNADDFLLWLNFFVRFRQESADFLLLLGQEAGFELEAAAFHFQRAQNEDRFVFSGFLQLENTKSGFNKEISGLVQREKRKSPGQ